MSDGEWLRHVLGVPWLLFSDPVRQTRALPTARRSCGRWFLWVFCAVGNRCGCGLRSFEDGWRARVGRLAGRRII